MWKYNVMHAYHTTYHTTRGSLCGRGVVYLCSKLCFCFYVAGDEASMCSSQACSKLVMLQRLYACFDTCYCVSPLCKVVYSVCLYVCDYIVNNEHTISSFYDKTFQVRACVYI